MLVYVKRFLSNDNLCQNPVRSLFQLLSLAVLWFLKDKHQMILSNPK